MKILLINNNTQHLRALNKALAGHEVEIQKYQPGLEFNDRGKDLVILSGGGGEGLEIYDKIARGKYWYQDEMEYVLRTDKPVLGICMGFEVICSAYGSKLNEMPTLLEGYMKLSTTPDGKGMLGKDRLRQYEAHQWQVPSVSAKYFEVIAESETGIEMIKHKTKRMLGTQFHPEKGGSLGLQNLFAYI